MGVCVGVGVGVAYGRDRLRISPAIHDGPYSCVVNRSKGGYGARQNFLQFLDSYFLFSWYFLGNAIDFMKKTIRQREAQIDQMDRFLELYKKVNGLNSSLRND